MPSYFLYALVFTSVLFTQKNAAAEKLGSCGPLLPVFERVWGKGKNEIYPATLSKKFSPQVQTELAARACHASSLEELAGILNPFLFSLGISHTKFYQTKDPDYYFMRSLFSTSDPDSHPIWHIGAQLFETSRGLRIREVLEGYPAHLSGLRRGDLLLSCDSTLFHPIDCFATGGVTKLLIERNSATQTIVVQPVFESPARSFIQAMKNSVRIIEKKDGRKIGYLHFWVGAFQANVREYDAIIKNDLFQTDGLILDLRGGFGGASLERVDPFFSDRTSYAVMTGVSRDGVATAPGAWPHFTNPNPYTKPMIVLINEGVRSGKEMMAFQFKKTARAKLIGTTTAGMFVAGRMWFLEEKEDYLLYLATIGAQLDGVTLEGMGVKPDLEVPYPLETTLLHDPQFDAALESL